MHFLDDSPSPAHVDQFLFGFDRPLPIHQGPCVSELDVWKFVQQSNMGGGGIIILHLVADSVSVPTTRFDDSGQMLLRMALRRLHVKVGIELEPSVIHEDGGLSTVDVLLAAAPNRVFEASLVLQLLTSAG